MYANDAAHTRNGRCSGLGLVRHVQGPLPGRHGLHPADTSRDRSPSLYAANLLLARRAFSSNVRHSEARSLWSPSPSPPQPKTLIVGGPISGTNKYKDARWLERRAVLTALSPCRSGLPYPLAVNTSTTASYFEFSRFGAFNAAYTTLLS